MNYAIMRCKKLKGMGSVAASLDHYYRERDTPNADIERTPLNLYKLGATTDETMGKLRSKLPEKRRKDAVLAVEYMMTASPEWWKTASKEQQQVFFQQSAKWLVDKYGKENVLAFGIHRDETSPHISAFVVPITQDGRLSAKDYIGGRDKLRNDQTTYAQPLERLGLERGVRGSKAQHKTIQKYYGEMEQLPDRVEKEVHYAMQIERKRVKAEAEKFVEQVKESAARERQERIGATQSAQDALNRASEAEALTERLRAALVVRDKEIAALKAENRELQRDDDHDFAM